MLTKDAKKLLKIINQTPPDLQGRFHTVSALYSISNMKYDALLSVLLLLADNKCLQWADNQKTTFFMLEPGRKYRELNLQNVMLYFLNNWISILAFAISAAAFIKSFFF